MKTRNKILLFILSTVLILNIIIVNFVIAKADATMEVTLNCNEVASAGSKVTCTVYVESKNNDGYNGLQADFDLASGLTIDYTSIKGNAFFNYKCGTDNICFINTDQNYIKEKKDICSFEVNIPSNVSEKEYKIGLKDIQVTAESVRGGYTVGNVSTTV